MLAINKIQEASTCIYDLANYGDCTDIVKNELKQVYKLMEEFIRANTKEKGGRLDMFKFTLCKETTKDGSYMRPGMAGVYHDSDNQVAVSSDTHILIASKNDYKPEHAGHTLTKKGEILGTEEFPVKFPKWKSIIPDVNNGNYVKLNKAVLEEKIRQAQAAKKLTKEKCVYFYIHMNFIKGGNEREVYFRLEYIETLLGMPGDIWVCDYNRSAYYSDDNYEVVVMPVYGPENGESIDRLHRVF